MTWLSKSSHEMMIFWYIQLVAATMFYEQDHTRNHLCSLCQKEQASSA